MYKRKTANLRESTRQINNQTNIDNNSKSNSNSRSNSRNNSKAQSPIRSSENSFLDDLAISLKQDEVKYVRSKGPMVGNSYSTNSNANTNIYTPASNMYNHFTAKEIEEEEKRSKNRDSLILDSKETKDANSNSKFKLGENHDLNSFVYEESKFNSIIIINLRGGSNRKVKLRL